MMGQELDELGEFDNEFVDNISKFKKFLTACNIQYKYVIYWYTVICGPQVMLFS